MEYKWIKDTVHGYIKIEKEFLQIVNAPEFQRLKWIEQGSFRVLYPSARHDRFIHSLGVFGLARECFGTLIENVTEDLGMKLDENLVEKWKYTFLYAALLHDIGHAPFSHTFEPFFLGKHGMNGESDLCREVKEIINDLNQKADNPCDISTLDKKDIDLLNAVSNIKDIDQNQIEGFVNDYLIENGGIIPKPHEILSATILIEKFDDFMKNTSIYNKIDLNTAARMVIGCTYYYNAEDDSHDIENILIRLLNSSFLDVDKLDYIIRDTKMSGYDNVTLDIKRLLRSVTAIRKEEGIYPAYNKRVLSTIDNLFRAKIQENMWMISHPVVEYERKLIIACVQEFDKSHKGYTEYVFTKEALGQNGVTFMQNGQKCQYRLLSDMDILCDIKSLFADDNSVVMEYFDSNRRKHPLWKSLYDYRFIWNENELNISLEEIHDFFSPLISYLEYYKYFTFDKNIYNKILKQKDEKIIKSAKIFAQICDENGEIEFAFTILDMKSNFWGNVDEKKIYICFKNDITGKGYETYYNLVRKSEDISEDSKNKCNNFFYVYSKTKLEAKDIQKFVKLTIETIIESKMKPEKKKRTRV